MGKDKKKPDMKRKQKKLTRKEMKERDEPLSLLGEDPDDVLGSCWVLIKTQRRRTKKIHGLQ